MNYTDQLRDVITLAHEFGHVVHGALALERQPYRAYHTGLAVAEVPSTFTQLLVVERLIEREEDPSTRAMLLADRAESAMASIFRQSMMARFEQRAYGIRAEGKALTSDRLADVWIEENAKYYGDSLGLPDGYRLGWSYIPHFIHVRFYTYAYAFAHLVAFSLLARYREDREAFVPAWLDLLGNGASRSPQDLLAAGRSRPSRPGDVGARVRRVRPLHRGGRSRPRRARRFLGPVSSRARSSRATRCRRTSCTRRHRSPCTGRSWTR